MSDPHLKRIVCDNPRRPCRRSRRRVCPQAYGVAGGHARQHLGIVCHWRGAAPATPRRHRMQAAGQARRTADGRGQARDPAGGNAASGNGQAVARRQSAIKEANNVPEETRLSSGTLFPCSTVGDLQKNKIPYIVAPLTGTSSQVLSTDERFLWGEPTTSNPHAKTLPKNS